MKIIKKDGTQEEYNADKIVIKGNSLPLLDAF